MKNNKGITLTSLIIYIAVIFVVIATLMRITTYFSSNMQDAADVSFETEFNKLNLYLLDETKTIGNGITNILEDRKQITFTNGNTYLYNTENKAIYLNETIKICENVENCEFEELVADNGKSVLELTIKIGDIEKTVNYIIKSITQYEIVLPAEYQEVEYIESTGTQYIDTKYIANENTSMETKAQVEKLDYSKDGALFGARIAPGNKDYVCWFNNYENVSSVYASVVISGETQKIQTDTNGEFDVHKILYNNNKLYLDDILIGEYTNKIVNSGLSLYLLALNQNGNVDSRGFYGKLYYCKIWDGDTLVRNFIPCYRISDSVVGLYDIVNDVFYTNSGTGEFLKGANKDTIIVADNEDFINEEDYIFNIGDNETQEPILPTEYQQVEYIQSSGTQYINTGVPQNEISEISGEFQFTSLGSSHQGICGRYTSNSTSINMVYNANTGNFSYRWGEASHNIASDLNKHSFIINSQSITIDDTILSTYSGNSLSDTDTLVIFARRTDNSGAAIINLASMKLYKFQIKNNDIIVRNFIPCYRKSDNVVGLYDTVNDVFYTNAGTGTFEKGANVE